ncbi:hypothetical protein ACWDLG_00445 [Nonomuraea sp. NPDC003727]
MRRYRFGRLAGLVAGGYVAAVVVLGVIATAGGDSGVLVWTAALRWVRGPVTLQWWEALYLIFLGGVHGWMLWQILRGRVSGERSRNEGAVRRLRLALYLNAASSLVFRVVPSPWWVDLLDGIAWLALVLLFPRVLIRASRALRVTALVVGAFIGVRAIGGTVADAFDLRLAEGILSFGLLGGLPWILWMVLILVAQANDGRWGRTTVWVGAASVTLPHLLVPMLGNPFMYLADGGNGFGLISGLYSTAGLLGPVWQARSAHDLASPPARAVLEKGGPVRAPSRWWPLAVVAVALPAVPAVVNLARGVPRWIGPRGVIASYFETNAGFYGPSVLWTAFDVLIGVGGLAALVLVAVVRRTRRLVRATVSALFLAAVVGVVSRFTPSRPAEDSAESWSIHPDAQPDFLRLFTWDGATFSGISPLWYSIAFVAAALLLMFLYGGSPADRSPFKIVVTAVASVAALCFVPAADQAPGQITTERECQRSRDGRGLSGERSFVCAVRESTVLKVAKNAPDPFVVAYGHRLCGIYTRNDPQELAQVRRTDGVEVRSLTYSLAGICPSAAAVVKAEGEREDREMREWEATQQRICDESPRHRPLTKPVAAIVQPEPVWTDYGNLEAFDPEITEDPYEATATHEDELVRVAPGHLAVTVHSDVPLCVTTETYTRRPPVETKGWHQVVEVGYDSLNGEIELADPMGGDPLPNLAVRGKGHYRIRVHYAWLTFEGQKYAGQRLLIMSYPGQGDDAVVHRERVKP